jgi:uncharacterized membrane protein YfcA
VLPARASTQPIPETIQQVDFTAGLIAFTLVALFIGGVTKGVLGIGLPLLSMPLMALVLGVKLAVATLTVPLVATNVMQAFEAGNPMRAVRRFWPTLVTLVIGLVVGTLLIAVIDRDTLYLVAGSMLIAVALQLSLNSTVRIPPRAEPWVGAVAGAAGGVLGGLSAMFGPPLAVFLVGLKLDKDEFVAAVSLLYAVGSIALFIAFSANVTLDAWTVAASFAACIPVYAGMWFGRAIRDRINAYVFRQIVLAVIGFTGAGLIYQALS